MYMLQAADQSMLDDRNGGVQVLHLAKIEQVIQVMREQLYESFSLEDMADVACLSPYYFCRIFHQIIGIPPGEFLTLLRLNAAKNLLLNSSLSVTDICFEVGYSGLGSFTTRFTQLVGVSPGQFRFYARNAAIAAPIVPGDERLAAGEWHPPAGSIGGEICAPPSFRGLIFAGLFPKPIPQGRPVRCTCLTAPGPYRLNAVPDGRYYLMAVALPESTDPRTLLVPDDTLYVGVQGPLLVRNGCAGEAADMMLRPARLTDPPLLTAQPYIGTFQNQALLARR